MKVCCRCELELNLDEFSNNKRKSDGKQPACKECVRKYDNTYYLNSAARRRQTREKNNRSIQRNLAYLWQWLSEHPCIDCDEPDPIVLEFDHVRGTKKNDVSTLARQSISLRLLKTEVDKCDVRCANCHKRKTAVQFDWYKYRDVG